MVKLHDLWILVATIAVAAPSFSADDFTRGDCNADGNISGGTLCDVSDPVFLLNFLFLAGGAPPCMDACDSNGDRDVNIADAVFQLWYCFLGGPAPPEPFPGCGRDPESTLGCVDFPWCHEGCGPQDARGVGPCDMIVGIFWDGLRCRYQSGCSCEGADCSGKYDSIAACYRAHLDCGSVCDRMEVRGIGSCEMVLGWFWDGLRCRALSGCECGGADCDRLYQGPDECEADVSGCAPYCEPMDALGVGPCAAILGWTFDGKRCQSLSGCSCEGKDCDRIHASPEECQASCLPPCVPMRVSGVGDCKKLLGYAWNGTSCEALGGCSCAGEDCDLLYESPQECELAYESCR